MVEGRKVIETLKRKLWFWTAGFLISIQSGVDGVVSFVVYLDNCENGHSVFHLCSFCRAKLRNRVFSLFNLKQKQSKLNAISKYTFLMYSNQTHNISLCTCNQITLLSKSCERVNSNTEKRSHNVEVRFYSFE